MTVPVEIFWLVWGTNRLNNAYGRRQIQPPIMLAF